MRPRVVLAIARTSLLEFLRTPEAVFWTYGFPVLMAIGLGIAFAGGSAEPVRVGILDDAEGVVAFERALGASDRIEVRILGMSEGERALTRGAIDLFLSGTRAQPVLDVDRARPSAELAMFVVERAFARDAGREPPPFAEIRPVTERGARYIDFLIPGLIGINLLGAGMYGIGFNMVNLRVRHLLRRLYVTPMRPSEFLFGYIVSRLILTVPEALFVVGFGSLAFGVPVHGSLLTLVVVVLAGGLAFSGIGLLVSARARTTEAVSGWINLVTLPMWILGGSFFSSERFPAALQPLVQALPLTHVNEGLRSVMLGGAGLADAAVQVPLAVLCGFALLSFVIAVRIFRWS